MSCLSSDLQLAPVKRHAIPNRGELPDLIANLQKFQGLAINFHENRKIANLLIRRDHAG